MFDNITMSNLKKKLNAGETLNIIDVREPFETQMGMIPGAINIPMNTIPENLEELSKNEIYYITCAAGGRSLNVCSYLGAHGYHVVNVIEGMSDW